jgi:hypothetical protein
VPTLAEIANQITNTLTQIETNTQDTADVVALIKGDTADLKTRLDTLTTATVAGFQFLGQGLYAMHELQRVANAHLATQVAQNTAILCWLETSAELLCSQLRLAERDAKLQQDMQASLKMLRSLFELVYPRELVDLQKLAELDARISACCPVATPFPEPCYQACAEPEIQRHDPRGQQWRPDFGGGTGDNPR